ncbi:MAG: hypothetical protein Q8L24_00565 [bacterium]|nr:hypothetical protein [bacterium]
MFDKLFGNLFSKAVDFLIGMFYNGIVALFITIAVGFVLTTLLYLAMIPVAIIIGANAAHHISVTVGPLGSGLLTLLYAVIFISLMLDDFGIPNLKTFTKKWWGGKQGKKKKTKA